MTVDQDKAMKAMSRGCLTGTFDPDACGWNSLWPLRELPPTEPGLLARRATITDRALDRACRDGPSDFGCVNYGIALSCGLLGPPDFAHAEHVWNRGCALGDTRGCDYTQALKYDRSALPSCDQIGGDPAVPVSMKLHLVPPPPGATLPADVEPFRRRLMPPL